MGNLIRDIIYLISAVALAAAVGIMGAVVFQEANRDPAPAQIAATPKPPQTATSPAPTATQPDSEEKASPAKETAGQTETGGGDQTGPKETAEAKPQAPAEPSQTQPTPDKPGAGDASAPRVDGAAPAEPAVSGAEGSGSLASSLESPAPKAASGDGGPPDGSAPDKPAQDPPASGKGAGVPPDQGKTAQDQSPPLAVEEKPKPIPSSKTTSKTDKTRNQADPGQDSSRPTKEATPEPKPEAADLLKTEALAAQEEVKNQGTEAPADQAEGRPEENGSAGRGSDDRGSGGRAADDRVKVTAIVPSLGVDETTLVRVDLSAEVKPTVKTFVNQKGQLKVAVDFPGVVRGGKVGSVIPSPSPLVKRITVGDHQDKLRLVLDLDMSRNYTVQHHQEGRVFTLRVTPE